jgi:hypothetical protein
MLNKKLTKAVLGSLIIRPDFKLTLNEALKRKEEISSNPNIVEIVVNEKNEVISGELDVVVLLGMEIKEFMVFQLSSQDTRRRGNSEIGEITLSAAKKGTTDLSSWITTRKKKS